MRGAGWLCMAAGDTKRFLGPTELNVSKIGLGTLQVSRKDTLHATICFVLYNLHIAMRTPWRPLGNSM